VRSPSLTSVQSAQPKPVSASKRGRKRKSTMDSNSDFDVSHFMDGQVGMYVCDFVHLRVVCLEVMLFLNGLGVPVPLHNGFLHIYRNFLFYFWNVLLFLNTFFFLSEIHVFLCPAKMVFLSGIGFYFWFPE